ncbi:MAG TPA: secondary thiamine-phosphate synthase enzyme YjbQ [Candidatus Acidoferrum sp.]|nr:secondary thiamine-phosphate synthase enzyme YjbQ [Candidatus Acidoferrum sp.]
MQSIRVQTARRTQMLDITEEVQRVVSALGIQSGTCLLYVPHTTAGILINEHADPDVASDAEEALDRLLPSSTTFRHAEGNSDSHVKTMLVGISQFVFVENGKLALGRWQGIFFAEFDGPRERQIYIKVLSDRD